MSNKTKVMLLWAALATMVAAVFIVTHTMTEGALAISVSAALLGAAVARLAYWRSIGRMMNNNTVVATDHGPAGRIDTIELFWRPG